jgi:hypothetical protein
MSRTKKLLTFSTAVLAPWLLTSAVVAQDSDQFGGRVAVTIGPNAVVGMVTAKALSSFDISFVDPAIGLYALGDRTNNAVDLVDTHDNIFLGFCGQGKFKGATGNNNTSGPDGVLIRDSREIWAGDGDSTVKVFDVAGCDGTTSPKQTIQTGMPSDMRADELCYDPVDQLILVANNAADPPFATLISTLGPTYVPVARITFNGMNGAPKSTNGIEQCQFSPRTGMFYITVPGVKDPDTGEGVVAVISPQSQKVVKVFPLPLAKCDTPQGMAVGPGHDILIGCNGQKGSTTHSSVIIDERNGNIVATVADESGPDEVWFNSGNNHYFLARSGAAGGGQLQQALGIIDAGTRVADTGINGIGPVNGTDGTKVCPPVPNPTPPPPTKADPKCVHPSAHSVAADSVTNKTFWPIPGSGPNDPAGLSTLCGNAGGSNTMGCILVINGVNDQDDKTAKNNDDNGNNNNGNSNKNCVAQGAPVMGVSGGEAKQLKVSCRD